MKPKRFQKVRRIIRGWTRPTRQEIKKYQDLIDRKIARKSREESDLITSKIAHQGFAGLLEGLEQASAQRSLKMFQLNSRISAKYALDAVGIDYSKKKQETRKRVQDIMRRFTYTNRTVQDETERTNRLAILDKELETELGKKALPFLIRFMEIMGIMKKM